MITKHRILEFLDYVKDPEIPVTNRVSRMKMVHQSALMYTFSIIAVLLIASTCTGQDCDTIGGRAVNCVDANGLKHGHWMEGRKEVIRSVHSGYGSNQGCQQLVEYEWITFAEGGYANDKKSGHWTYYNRTPRRQGRKLYTLTYSSDGEVREGEVDRLGQVVHLRCHATDCQFLGVNGSPQLFPRELLDFELERLLGGAYDRALGLVPSE